MKLWSSTLSASSSFSSSRPIPPSPLLLQQHPSCSPTPSSSALSYSCSPSPPTLSAAPLPSVRGRPCPRPLRALPARDVVIDFGKFRGCKLGTLPSSYLRWLCRQVSPRYSIWAEYAQEVLQDPYYRDRLEYEMIEKLTMRGNIPTSASPGGETGVKGSMLALGWDLSDRAAWSKVNLSSLGTTAGGRIPRKPAADAANNSVPSRIPRVSTRKKKETAAAAASPEPQRRESSALTLQEELMRRRQLRRERASPALSKKGTLMQSKSGVFPGRDVLLEKLKKKMTE